MSVRELVNDIVSKVKATDSSKKNVKQVLSSLVTGLQKCIENKEGALNQKEYWRKKYWQQHHDYCALTRSLWCDKCSETVRNTPEGQTYTCCLDCEKRGQPEVERDIRESIKKYQADALYWQRCYEELLEEYQRKQYGELWPESF